MRDLNIGQDNMDWSVWAIKLPDIQIFIFLIGLEVGAS